MAKLNKHLVSAYFVPGPGNTKTKAIVSTCEGFPALEGEGWRARSRHSPLNAGVEAAQNPWHTKKASDSERLLGRNDVRVLEGGWMKTVQALPARIRNKV